MEQELEDKTKDDLLQIVDIGRSFSFAMRRTEKIGVGAIFDSEKLNEKISLDEEIIRPSVNGYATTLVKHLHKIFSHIIFYCNQKACELDECFRKETFDNAMFLTIIPTFRFANVSVEFAEPPTIIKLDIPSAYGQDIAISGNEKRFVI